MSAARNRELLGPIPVALLGTAGFAAVLLQESARLGNLRPRPPLPPTFDRARREPNSAGRAAGASEGT